MVLNKDITLVEYHVFRSAHVKETPMSGKRKGYQTIRDWPDRAKFQRTRAEIGNDITRTTILREFMLLTNSTRLNATDRSVGVQLFVIGCAAAEEFDKGLRVSNSVD